MQYFRMLNKCMDVIFLHPTCILICLKVLNFPRVFLKKKTIVQLEILISYSHSHLKCISFIWQILSLLLLFQTKCEIFSHNKSAISWDQQSAETSNQLIPAIGWGQQSENRTQVDQPSSDRKRYRWLDILTFRGLLTEVRLIFSYWF